MGFCVCACATNHCDVNFSSAELIEFRVFSLLKMKNMDFPHCVQFDRLNRNLFRTVLNVFARDVCMIVFHWNRDPNGILFDS